MSYQDEHAKLLLTVLVGLEKIEESEVRVPYQLARWMAGVQAQIAQHRAVLEAIATHPAQEVKPDGTQGNRIHGQGEGEGGTEGRPEGRPEEGGQGAPRPPQGLMTAACEHQGLHSTCRGYIENLGRCNCPCHTNPNSMEALAARKDAMIARTKGL